MSNQKIIVEMLIMIIMIIMIIIKIKLIFYKHIDTNYYNNIKNNKIDDDYQDYTMIMI